ncbi:ybaK/ebsC family protein [Bacillus cereus]|nr:ybaK/ebsC family protein [Bacillus cereus]
MGKSTMFKDFNFKLVVIEALLNKEPLFLNELKDLIDKYTNNFEWYSGAGVIVEIRDYLEGLTLAISDLEKIESLCFDGGNEIYHILKPDWDGEDSLFDVVSVEGFQCLKNLKTVEYISMCYPKVLEPFKQAGIAIEN